MNVTVEDSGLGPANTKTQAALLDKLSEEICRSFAEFDLKSKSWVLSDKRRCFEVETLALIKYKVAHCKSVPK